MRDPGGGFYSAEDADSEGIEGKYYLWKDAEIKEVLGDDAPVFIRTYHIRPEGNFFSQETGHLTGENILHLSPAPERPEPSTPLTEDGLADTLSDAKGLLFAIRKRRVPPSKDDKVLTDWNGLVISALSLAARAFGDNRYLEAATNAADFILGTMRTGKGELLHRYRDGTAGIRGVASDYAYFCAGLLDLYELTFAPEYLEAAIGIEDYFSRHFLDRAGGGYFISHDEDTDLLIRQKDIYDGALPSVNSVALKNLVRLGLMITSSRYHEQAWDLAGSFYALVEQSPAGYTEFLSSLDFAFGPAASVVLVGFDRGPDMVAMKEAINSRFFPSLVLLYRPGGEGPYEIDRISGFTKDMRDTGGNATVFVCKNHACSYPSIDPGTVIADLEQMYKKPGGQGESKKIIRDFSGRQGL
jgi:hypothetical protein